MRALPAAVVALVVLSGCLSALTLPGESPHTETADGSVYVVGPGETVSVTQSFGNLKRLHVESVSAPGSGSWQDSIRLGTPQLDPAQSYQEDSYPPRHVWGSPTDVNATHTFFVQEDATPGVYRFAVVPEHGYGASDGERRAVVIRVVESESG